MLSKEQMYFPQRESQLKVVVFLSLSRVQPFVTPRMVAHQAPLPMEFFRQEYWRGLPFPSPENLPDPGIEPLSPALQLAGRFFTNEPPRKPKVHIQFISVQFSHSVMSDSLRPHELQHARPSCPSPTPGVHPESCPSSR